MIRMHGPSDGIHAPTQHTLQPVVTGTSVLGLQCADGVLMCADTLGASVAFFPSCLLCLLTDRERQTRR